MRLPTILSRRQLLLLTGPAVTVWANRDDFWNTKPPPEWDASQIYRLMNHSPWANAVQGWIPGQETVIHKRKGATIQGTPWEYGPKGVVTWESAEPIREAMKSGTSPVFENYHVLGVGNIPTGGFSVTELRSNAVLSSTRKPRWALGAIDARELDCATGVVYEFLFSKSEASIGPKSGDIIFEALFGRWTIRTAFKSQEMIYRGRPAF